MDNFLENKILPKLIQEEIRNLYIPITIEEFELIYENLPTKQTPDLDGCTSKC